MKAKTRLGPMLPPETLRSSNAQPTPQTDNEGSVATPFDAAFERLLPVRVGRMAAQTIASTRDAIAQRLELRAVEDTLTSLEALVAKGGKHQTEMTLFSKALASLREEASKLAPDQRVDFLKEALLWGKNNPNRDSDYSAIQRNLVLGALGALTALGNPVTAALLPIVIKGGIDLGPFVQAFMHAHGDEIPDATLPTDFLPGDTISAFASAQEWRASYEQYVRDVVDRKLPLNPLQRYAGNGAPHHTWASRTEATSLTTNDPLFANPDLEVAFMKSSTDTMKLTGLAGALGPVGGLVSGFALGFFPSLAAGALTHKMAHEPHANKSLLVLALQATGIIETKAEHDLHHTENADPVHARNFGATLPAADEMLTKTNALDLFNIIAESTTQHRRVEKGGVKPARPQSWARNPLERVRAVGVSDVQLADAIKATGLNERAVADASVCLGTRPELLVGAAGLGQVSTAKLKEALRTLGASPEAASNLLGGESDHVNASLPFMERLLEAAGVTPRQLSEARAALGVAPQAISIRVAHEQLVEFHGALTKLQRQDELALRAALASGTGIDEAQNRLANCGFLDEPLSQYPQLVAMMRRMNDSLALADAAAFQPATVAEA